MEKRGARSLAKRTLRAVWPGLLVFVGITASLRGVEPEFSDVFTSGAEGFASIRIPSAVVTAKGTVLAFAEGRARPDDQAENKIVAKRSTDGGRTWNALSVLHDDEANSLNNPTSVMDQQSGRIFLLYQRIPAHLKEASEDVATGLEGPKIYRNLLVWSDDDGVTWTRPLDVTAMTKRPERATTIASGPGSGLQLTRGPHAGRLIFPFNEGPFWKWQDFAVFSDDHGATWKYGGDVPGALIPDAKLGERSQINEAQMVEMNDGAVRLDSRQFAGAKVRKTSVSRDGGETWSPVSDLPDLPDPSCMAGVLRYSFDDGTGHGKLLHTGPDSTQRDHGTVYLSLDDGWAWPIKRELWPGGFAYSVPVRLADGAAGCLFEADNYRRIVFARFSVGWVTQGVNLATIPEARHATWGNYAGWMERHEAKLAEIKGRNPDLVFLGDSITQRWENTGNKVWKKHFAARNALNLGFEGDGTQQVLWRLDHGEFDGLHPKVCVLLIGTNNGRHSDCTGEEIVAGVRAIIDRISAKSPTTRILLHAIFPRGAAAVNPWRERCQEINALLPALADGEHVHYMDIGSKLTKADGTISAAIMPDFLHPSAAGYEIWAAAIEPKLNELMNGVSR